MDFKLRKKHGTILSIISILVVGLLTFVSIFAAIPFHIEKWPDPAIAVLVLIKWSCCLIPILMFLFSNVKNKRYLRKLEEEKVAATRSFLNEQRSNAGRSAADRLATLICLRKHSKRRAWILIFCSVAAAITAGLTSVLTTLSFNARVSIPILILFLSYANLNAALTRLCFRNMIYTPEEDAFDCSRERFPYLYKLAERAKNELNCTGDIIISLNADCNMGIRRFTDVLHVELGVYLVGICSEDELYATFLHEFAHIKNDERDGGAYEYVYADWLQNGISQGNEQWFFDSMFSYEDNQYLYEFEIYEYTLSMQKEFTADNAMKAMPKAAASVMLKLFYYERFQWEAQAMDGTPLYASEQVLAHVVSDELTDWKKQVSVRANDWNHLLCTELPAQSDSHPTTKMRLDALGIFDYCLIEDNSCDEFRTEREKMILSVDERVAQKLAENYEETRQEEYLEPSKRVLQWEAEGCPIVSYEYTDIVGALLALHRISEARTTCDRAIDELDKAEAAFAYLVKGKLLLRDYDDTGIDFLYQACDSNHNLVDAAMEEIGYYLCLTGKKSELETYRKKADEMMQQSIDEYAQLAVLTPKDNLSFETLTEEALSSLIAFIKTIDDGSILHLWLIRKTLKSGLYSSVVVIEYKKNTHPDIQDALYNKIFCYLDAQDHQYSLISYNHLSGKSRRIVSKKGNCIYND